MLLPQVVATSALALALLFPSFTVKFEDTMDLNDVGESYRYIGKSYGDTTGCKVFIDENNLALTHRRVKSKSLSISNEVLRSFILLHELMHCYDNKPAPAGVNSLVWREYLADSFAATELYASGEIKMSVYEGLASFRRSLPVSDADNSILQFAPFVQEAAMGTTTEERLAILLAFRDMRFNSRIKEVDALATR